MSEYTKQQRTTDLAGLSGRWKRLMEDMFDRLERVEADRLMVPFPPAAASTRDPGVSREDVIRSLLAPDAPMPGWWRRWIAVQLRADGERIAELESSLLVVPPKAALDILAEALVRAYNLGMDEKGLEVNAPHLLLERLLGEEVP